jgi:hypothetical protein
LSPCGSNYSPVYVFAARNTAVSANHRFQPPWSVKEQDGRFVVQDNNVRTLSHVYFTDKSSRRYKPGRRLFTRDEARYLVASVAKLPEL